MWWILITSQEEDWHANSGQTMSEIGLPNWEMSPDALRFYPSSLAGSPIKPAFPRYFWEVKDIISCTNLGASSSCPCSNELSELRFAFFEILRRGYQAREDGLVRRNLMTRSFAADNDRSHHSRSFSAIRNILFSLWDKIVSSYVPRSSHEEWILICNLLII